MKSYFRALMCALLVSMPTANASVAFKESLLTPEGDIRLVFTLEKVALINAYALDDPSRIVIDIKDVAMGEIKSTKLGPVQSISCLLYTSPSPRDGLLSRMPSSA